ncbi:MAG: small-conductance mechanosensitive channel [Planctomycetota bacterium]|jgi:small-conductance mechanosensitive channel
MIIWGVVVVLAIVLWIGSEVLQNLFVRVVWVLRAPFGKGDFVSIGGVGGKVERVGWQAVQLRSSSGDLVFIANRQIWKKPIVQTVAESGSQGIEMHLPVYADCDQIRARLAAREAVILSPYLALDRPIDVALELGEGGEVQVRVQAGVFDASQRALFESSVIESYRAILTEQ